MTAQERIEECLNFIYGPRLAGPVIEQLIQRLADFKQHYPGPGQAGDPGQRLSQADAVLITYGDQVQEPGKPYLQSLAEVLNERLAGIISSVHILPFYPYSSDDGFSVIDYTRVDPELGDWDDLERLRANFRLMFDAVINHISAQSAWFRAFLEDQPPYSAYFITEDPAADLSSVTRPRTSPLLTPVETTSGVKHVWTTFSADQVDLNYKNPAVLLDIIDVLLLYVARGAEFIRLDAIAYIWKEVGTACIHLPQAHKIVQLFRAVLDEIAPGVMIITETNVPHAENVSYFGDGRHEAQLVYQFSLGPLALHSFRTGNASKLQAWAAGLEKLPETATFFNFIASHDGIGLRPAEGILTQEEIQALAEQTLARGGQVSYKTNSDGSRSPYELNITLFDMLSDVNDDGETETLRIKRFMACQAILLALVGVPGIYIHSLVGSSNYSQGLAITGRARSLNREKWQRADLETRLNDPYSRAYQVFQHYVNMLRARAAQPAFHPNGEQQVVDGGNPALFSLLRISPDGREQVLCLHNISANPQQFSADAAGLSMRGRLSDILTGDTFRLDSAILQLSLAPYEVRWLAREAGD